MRNIAKQFTMKLSLIDISVIQPKYKCFYGEDVELNVSVVGETGRGVDLTSTFVKVYYQIKDGEDLRQDDYVTMISPTVGRFNVLVKKHYLRVGLNTVRVVIYDNDQEVILQPAQILCLETGLQDETDDVIVDDSINVKDEFGKTNGKVAELTGQVVDLDSRLDVVEDEIVDINASLEHNTLLINNKMDKNTTNISISQINKNNGKIDQTYLSDELIQQMAGNTPVNAIVGDKSITRNKLTDSVIGVNQLENLDKSTNLYNDNTVSIGYVIGTDGVVSTNASYTSTDFIEVNPGTSYSFYGFVLVAYYDKDKNFISRSSYFTSTVANTITLASNVYYIRLCFQGALYVLNRQLNVGSNLVTFEYWRKPFIKGIESKEISNKSISTLKIIDNAITPSKANFIVKSTNLFKSTEITSGYYISSTGIPTVNTSYSYTDLIEVEPSTEYTLQGSTDVSFYDENKNFISRLSAINKTITTLRNCYFVRINFQGAFSGTIRQMNKGTTLGTYEDYKLTLSDEIKINGFLSNNPNDKIMFDLPIDRVFSTNKDYSEDDFTDLINIKSSSVYTLYDNLMSAFPSYITKEVLGNDLYGNTISLYRFKPTLPTSSKTTKLPKIFLTCGVHGYEHVSAFTTYLFLKQMCNEWTSNDLLEALRFGVEFLVIPIVNPSGWDDYSRKNRNGVDINRNFAEGWYLQDVTSETFGGDSANSELETQYVVNVFNNNPDIDICYDFHNFSGTSNTTHFIWIPTGSGSYVEHMAQNLISRLTRKWRKSYNWLPTAENYFVGYSSGENGGMVQDEARSRGIKFSGTIEVCGRWWLEPNTKPMNSTHKITSVETLVNWLLINLNEIKSLK